MNKQKKFLYTDRVRQRFEVCVIYLLKTNHFGYT